MPIVILAGGEAGPDFHGDPRLQELDTSEWLGKDGRAAQILWLNASRRLRASN